MTVHVRHERACRAKRSIDCDAFSCIGERVCLRQARSIPISVHDVLNRRSAADVAEHGFPLIPSLEKRLVVGRRHAVFHAVPAYHDGVSLGRRILQGCDKPINLILAEMLNRASLRVRSRRVVGVKHDDTYSA